MQVWVVFWPCCDVAGGECGAVEERDVAHLRPCLPEALAHLKPWHM